MNVQMMEADKTLLSKWDSLVEETSQGTIFHRLNWLKIVEKHTRGKLYPLIGFKGEEIVGVFPVFCQDFMASLFRASLSPPASSLVPYLGPLFPNYDKYKQNKKESTLKDFQKAVDDFLVQHIDPNYVSIVFSPGFLDMRAYQWSGYDVRPRYTYVKDVSDIESVWKGLKKQLRQSIRKAERRGVTVKEGNKKDLDFIHSSSSRRLKEQQLFLETPKEYFHDLYNVFYPRNLRIFTTEYNGQKVSGVIITCHKGKVSGWFGTDRPDFKRFHPNEHAAIKEVNKLLNWAAIKWANEHGFKKYEEIGANTPRLTPFKSKFNLDLQLYFSVSKYSSWLIKYAKSVYLKSIVPVTQKIYSKKWR